MAPSHLPAQASAADSTKRPMTFADMMHMRRLGDTAVSTDGKWLVYSVTDVDLAKNSRTATLWIQSVVAGEPSGEPKPLAGTQAGDSGACFSPDGKQILFLSSRGESQQIWLADFDSASGLTTNVRNPTINHANSTVKLPDSNEKLPNSTTKLTDFDNAEWSPDGKSIVFTSAVYPDCPPVTAQNPSGFQCTVDRDAAQSASPVKARVFDHLLYKHWNAFTGDKRNHLFLLTLADSEVSGDSHSEIRDLTPNDPHDVPPFSMGGGGGFAFSPDSKELAFTENLDEEPAISTNADIFTLDLTNSAAKPVKVSTSLGGDFSPSYSPDGKYLAWRSQARASYESDKFRLVLYNRTTKSIRDLLPNFDRWVDEFTWKPDSAGLYLTSGNAGESPIYAVTLDGKLTQI
jgi:Tol biopolymer transport system component